MSFSGKDGTTYIIAEISANHNGSLDAALQLVRIAKECGADAVKIQTYTADTLTLDCDNEYFRISGGTLWDGKTLHQLYEEAHTPWEWHEAIFAEAKKVGIECFSTPFDETAVDFLEQCDPPCHKIASFELVHDPLLKKVAATGRPVILSTGMATLEEIAHAVGVLRAGGCGELALLKCTSSYPAPAEEANLARIPHMAQAFGCRAGLSDHTLGIAVPVAAVALGASIIEKHLCRSRSEPGPDSAFSLEPAEFRQMCEAVRTAHKAIGTVTYELTAAEQKGIAFRRSLFFERELPAGHRIVEGDIRVVRPSHGLAPRHLDSILGRELTGGRAGHAGGLVML
jgi:pseudaminic acid synthase